MSPRPLGLGLIGCGSFGLFCMETYRRLDGLRPVAAADAHKPAADHAASRYGDLAVHYSAAELIDRDDVDIVHVATPPATHHGLALRAARAGKHVLCEKPLAMTTPEADEMLAAAQHAGTLMPVNFVLRHNPVTDAVREIIAGGVLGRPLRASLENNAGDENLGPGHWFWDKSSSGGIFIEHGVHFFDLYRYWFGPGRVVAAHAELREHTAQEDRVTCLVRHDDGTLASHYHGFDQPGRLDRTAHRLLFELGDVTVNGWIPLELVVHGVVDDAGLERIEQACRNLSSDVEVLERYEGSAERFCSRGKDRRATQKVRVAARVPMPKQELYAWSVAQLMADQVAAIRSPEHRRVVREENGRQSVAMAEAAAALAGDARRAQPPSQ